MKPGDFYLGVSEVFSVLVPGFVVTIIISHYFKILNYHDASLNEWALILVTSYICGHILFAIGSVWDELYDKMKPKGNEGLLAKIGEIRELKNLKDCKSINKYKWCNSVLSKIHPEGYADVLRKEADSKLFRSLLIPLIIILIFLLWSNEYNYNYSIIAGVMVFISFFRYRGQRFKACKISYTNVIVLNQLELLK